MVLHIQIGSHYSDKAALAIMRIVIVLNKDVGPLVESILGRLTNVIKVISKTPTNPKFNHYAFETLASLVRFSCSSNLALVTSVETFLFPPFQVILQQENGGRSLLIYVMRLSTENRRLQSICLPNTLAASCISRGAVSSRSIRSNARVLFVASFLGGPRQRAGPSKATTNVFCERIQGYCRERSAAPCPWSGP